MHLRSIRDPSYFYIDWWLHNHCNYSCSYCPDLIKNKSIPLPDINQCIEIVDQINQHASNLGKKCFFNIVGGEVTTWPLFIDLARHIKIKESKVSLRTNASCELIQWTALQKNIDSINFEYHPEFTGQSHFLLMVSESMKQQKEVYIVFNMMADDWDKSESFLNKVKTLWPDINVSKKILFNDPAINKEMQNYTDDQLDNLITDNGPLIYKVDNVIEHTNYNKLIIEGKNKFFNCKCNIGVEQIIIDAWGRVAKGHCRAGGHIGRLGKGIKFDNTHTICPFESCRNAFDILATKFS